MSGPPRQPVVEGSTLTRPWVLWLSLTLTTTIFSCVGLGLFVGISIPLTSQINLPALLAVTLYFLMLGAVFGIVIGSVQSMLCDRYVSLSAGSLILWSTIGAGLGFPIIGLSLLAGPTSLLHPALSPFALAACGTVVGFFQWIALRSAISNARLLIVASTTSWTIAWLVGFILVKLFPTTGSSDPLPSVDDMLKLALYPTLFMLVLGSINAAALVWLLHRTPSYAPTLPDKPTPPPNTTHPN